LPSRLASSNTKSACQDNVDCGSEYYKCSDEKCTKTKQRLAQAPLTARHHTGLPKIGEAPYNIGGLKGCSAYRITTSDNRCAAHAIC
jgi:hypothetical protein